MPSRIVQRKLHRTLRSSLVAVGVATFASSLTALAGIETEVAAVEVPPQCSEHHEVGEPDAPGDYHCAGMAITFADSVNGSTTSVWAGQWLFVDGSGMARIGIPTSVTGVHPSVATRAQSVPLKLANDPGGARLGYLLWKYGATSDDLTAAGLWAVTQYYAGGLVPAATLDGIAAATGRDDLQRRAIELDGEAGWFAQPWVLSASASSDGEVTQLVVALRSGIAPVSDRPVSALVSGLDRPLAATTGADGTATVSVPSGVGRFGPGAGTVVVTTESPGLLVAYRSTPAVVGAVTRTMVVSGRAAIIRAEPTAEAIPTATSEATTPPDPSAFPVAPEPLPHTGSHITEIVAGAATGLLVAGIGMVGAVRRRGRALVHSRP